jgi:hypothetical protein
MSDGLLKIPDRIEVEGNVRIDPSSCVARLAPAPGVVVTSVPPDAFVARGDVVMSIHGSRYSVAQKLFIRALLKKSAGREFKAAHTRLKQRLKFADRQLDEIALKRAVIDPLPILAPADGFVIAPLPVGLSFRKSESLFHLSSDQFIEASVEQNIADFLRPHKLAEISRFGSGDFARFVGKTTPDAAGKCQCTFRFDNPAHRGDPITLCLEFAVWERLSPTFTSDDWHFSSVPRGSDLYRLGLRKRPAPIVQSAVVPRPKPVNPFAAGADNRPPRIPAAYGSAETSTIAKESHRHTVELSSADWRSLSISTTLAEQHNFIPAWETGGTLRDQTGNDFIVTAPRSGIFKSVPMRSLQQSLTSTEVIGHIYRNDGGEQPIEVRSGCAGLLTNVTNDAPVQLGDRLAFIKPAPQVLQVASVSAASTSLRLRVCQLASAGDVLFSRSQIRLIASRGGIPSVDVPFLTDLGNFKQGHAFSVFLDEPDASRWSLALPKDCVMTQDNSHEVLVHHGSGKLTPVAVDVGIDGGFVEIRHGLSKHHHVVRDLKALCGIDNRLRAVMTGFWWG